MSNFYCLECDKIQRHFNMGIIIKERKVILRCSVCGKDQSFAEEDYVKVPSHLRRQYEMQ